MISLQASLLSSFPLPQLKLVKVRSGERTETGQPQLIPSHWKLTLHTTHNNFLNIFYTTKMIVAVSRITWLRVGVHRETYAQNQKNWTKPAGKSAWIAKALGFGLWNWLPGFGCWCCLLKHLWPWKSPFTFPCISFFIYKM